MGVPGTFRFSSTEQDTTIRLQDEKALPVVSPRIFEPRFLNPSTPVIISPQRKNRKPSISPLKSKSSRNRSQGTPGAHSHSSTKPEVPVPAHVSILLDATAIPVPRNWAGRKQHRLAEGNNPEDLNASVTKAIEGKEDGSMTRRSRQGSLDILLSPPNELEDDDKLTAGSETPKSIGSSSLDSIPSLDNDDDVSTPFTEIETPSFSSQRLSFTRKQRVFSPPEACSQDHPLLSSSPLSEDHIFPNDTPTKISSDSSNRFRPFPKLGATVKSNLTASLRALRSAAQSVSNFTAPSVRSDDFLTRSFFSFSPELTDDKHPVPMKNPPSPALRRYLNPSTISATDIHVYSETPRGMASEPVRCTASIQMETYHSSVLKKARRNHPLPTDDDRDDDYNDDYEYEDQDPPQIPVQRQREPRENSDFLRVVVLEMNMRRVGKLRNDIPGRAKVWLPPRKMGPISDDIVCLRVDGCADCKIPRRWIAISVDECC
ncbi:hypothetical protein AJ79_09177 [Helicocarpus griseus UAMH5409]|uniref:Uncharacterized protein n=1 Tax=Helicocarpus griseus UAMH5409 TaxID=1447875 RepID=A0A2B7WLX5_9EURO|nr:hypothetical protein AJ79_09177 [Helicocarpus griseus UAMH5409]